MIINTASLQLIKESFLEQLNEEEAQDGDRLAYAENRINCCNQYMVQLKEIAQTSQFADEPTEIFFFKEVKALVWSRQIFYRKMYKLHACLLHGCEQKEKEQLMDAVGQEVSFLQDHHDLYLYHNAGMTHFDRQYYIRSTFDWKTCWDTLQFDSHFSTSADSTLAGVMASGLFLKYTGSLLHEPMQAVLPAPSQKKRKLKWTRSFTDFVELVFAICLVDSFSENPTKDAIKETSETFGVDAKYFYQSLDQIKKRPGPVARYLRSLVEAFERHIDGSIA